MVIISHDRHFLNQVCTHMADLDYGKITIYPGNYDDFMEASSQARERQQNANAKAKERVAELQEFVRRFSANKSKAKQATSRLKLIDKIKPEDVKPSSRQYPWIRFDFDEKDKLHRLAVEIENLNFGYDPAKLLFKNFTCNIEAGDKIAVIGENGVGKTTFLKLLMGQLQPSYGTIKWAEKAKPGYYAQDHASDFAEDKSLTDWITEFVRQGGYEGGDVETLIRGTLGRLLFSGDEVKKSVKVISGGEQGRMLFGKLMLLHSRTCCCWTSPPTTWTWNPSNPSTPPWTCSRAPWCSSPTTGNSSPPWPPASSKSRRTASWTTRAPTRNTSPARASSKRQPRRPRQQPQTQEGTGISGRPCRGCPSLLPFRLPVVSPHVMTYDFAPDIYPERVRHEHLLYP